MARAEISRRSTEAFIWGAPIRIDDGKYASIYISGKWRKLAMGDRSGEAKGPCEVSSVEDARRAYSCEAHGYWVPLGSELSEDEFLVFDATTDG